MVSGRPISDGPADRLLRPVAYTIAPARASSTAIVRPAPRVAPATSATLPLSAEFWSVVMPGSSQHPPTETPPPARAAASPEPQPRQSHSLARAPPPPEPQRGALDQRGSA